MGSSGSSSVAPRTLSVALVVAAAIVPAAAMADVRREGDWSMDDEEVSLEANAIPRSEAVKRLATAAGWSVVLHAPKNDPVDVHVEDQPAGKVLDLLLSDAHYVARRDGELILISPADSVPPALPGLAPPALAPPPRPPTHDGDARRHRGSDRVITGGSLRVEKGDVVHDVTVMGGTVDVFGTVTGDLMVMGGDVRIREGGRVRGDAMAVGGALAVDDGARVDGDIGVVGGALRRGVGAKIGGEVSDRASHEARHGGRGGPAPAEIEADKPARSWSFARAARDAGSAVTRSALLFVYGAVLIALATERMERLKVQVASHPMKTFATGVVASLAAVALLVALCVTLVGIPFAIFLALFGFIAISAGVCAVLETAGAALLGHRTKNPYVHLAVGCAAFLLLGAIPFVGGFVKAVVVLSAIGTVAATRGAGLFPEKSRPVGSPYRDPQVAA